jgi:hypothetical protein
MPDPQEAQQLLQALALTGGTTVVAAMATDGWQAVRVRIARLFRRGDPAHRSAIDAQLANSNTLVAQAEDADRARTGLAALWQLQLEALLRECPDAEEELRALIAEVSDALPQAQQSWVQNITARDHSHAYGAQHGSVNIYHAIPGQAQPKGAADPAMDPGCGDIS